MKRAKNSAFNWSDEELLGDMEDVSDINYKQKYKKKNKKKLMNPYNQIKQTVQRISGKKQSPSKNFNQEPLNGHKT